MTANESPYPHIYHDEPPSTVSPGQASSPSVVEIRTTRTAHFADGLKVEIAPAVEEAVGDLMYNNCTITAIKLLRQQYRLPLRHAKDLVEVIVFNRYGNDRRS